MLCPNRHSCDRHCGYCACVRTLMPQSALTKASFPCVPFHMSRAFVKEQNGTEIPEDFPERPLSTHPNFVTANGLRLIEAHVHELESQREHARESEDKATLAGVERELRYWQQRKATARLTEPESPAS